MSPQTEGRGDKLFLVRIPLASAYAYAMIVHMRADQLLPRLLMEQFGTLPSQCYYVDSLNICVKEFG